MSLEWETFVAEDYCLRVADGTHDSPKEVEYGKKLVTSKNIIGGKLDLEKSYFISLDDFNEVNKRSKVDQWDILISMIGTVGEIALIKEKPDFAIKNVGLLKNNDEYKAKWLYYYLKSELGQYQIKSRLRGTTQLYIPLKDLRKLEIKVPKNHEDMIKIVRILDNIDKKIENCLNINHNLEQLAKSIYKHHFIDMKPYMLGDYIKESPLGIIPKDWSVQSIGEFVDDMKNGGTPRRGESEYWENGTIPWLKTGEINNNIILKSEEYITESGLKNSSAKLLPKNSIIMALYGKGTAARIGLLKIEATTNQACCAMICNDFNKTLFLYLFLLFNQKEIENLASGSVQQNLSKDLIANLNLVVPPIEIIENLPFKEIFDTMANNYFEIEYLTNLRDTLLPKLMSGEIDVSEINCDLKLIIRKFILKISTIWRIKYENKINFKNSKSNETLFKSRTVPKTNKFFVKFLKRYRNNRQ